MTNLGSVLLVDDDEVSNYISAQALHIANVTEQIAVAEDGHKALELVKKEPISVVLLDFTMSVMNGFEFLKALTQLREDTGANVPVIVMLTTSDSFIDKAITAKYPIKGFLIKPLTQGRVNRLINFLQKEAQ